MNDPHRISWRGSAAQLAEQVDATCPAIRAQPQEAVRCQRRLGHPEGISGRELHLAVTYNGATDTCTDHIWQ